MYKLFCLIPVKVKFDRDFYFKISNKEKGGKCLIVDIFFVKHKYKAYETFIDFVFSEYNVFVVRAR